MAKQNVCKACGDIFDPAEQARSKLESTAKYQLDDYCIECFLELAHGIMKATDSLPKSHEALWNRPLGQMYGVERIERQGDTTP